MDRYKTVKEKKEMYIDFTEEELQELGWKEKQRLSMEVKDNSIIIKPWATLELDTTGWSKEIFEMLVTMSFEQDKPVNDIIVDIIYKTLNKEESKEQLICE